MFIDNIKIYIKAGNGGDGAVSFHREKFVAAGGPDGGDGGHGGNIVFRVDTGANTLLAFRYKRKFVAENGGNGKADKFHGKSGEDTVVLVPPGTLLRDPESGKIIFDMASAPEYIAARGGRGGWGNRHFATPTRQIPRFAKPGTKGEEREILLELKMIADVGLIGFPSVGKSSLLAAVSSAKPKIAAYHFTTLSPNLGVVSVGEGGRGFVAADIPGLIEGAADGLGLGHAFLRHVERCRLLLHVVDIAKTEGRDPVEDVKAIDKELSRYSETLAKRPQIMVANKSDMLYGDEAYVKEFESYIQSLGRKLFYVSAVTGEGLKELINEVSATFRDLPEITVYEPEYVEEALDPAVVQETHIRRQNNDFYVEGIWLQNFMERIRLTDYESLNYFQRVLTKNGVFDMLRAKGVEEGDTVHIYDYEFDFVN